MQCAVIIGLSTIGLALVHHKTLWTLRKLIVIKPVAQSEINWTRKPS